MNAGSTPGKRSLIVVGGKGGVGKTAVSAVAAKLLVEHGVRLLVIDADPVISLAYALGESPGETIGDLRERVIEDPSEKRQLRDRPVKDALRDLVRRSAQGYDLLVMGRAEGPGCFCGLNELLRYGIESLTKDYAVSLVDCEAGIEQVNRRSVHRIDKLLLVTDTSRRGLEAVRKVRDIARKYDDGGSLEDLLIVNRLGCEEEKGRLQALLGSSDPKVLGWLPEDPNIREFNLSGRPLMDLPSDSPCVVAVKEILRRMALIA
ncbi:MAG: AAA family ATPase [bacterium]